MAAYVDKMKDPRWQKKRLEILERDRWRCVRCGNSTQEIHVHHKFYISGKEPWEHDGKCLVSLCKGCHDHEHKTAKDYRKILIETILGKGFLSGDLLELALSFSHMDKSEMRSIIDSHNQKGD